MRDEQRARQPGPGQGVKGGKRGELEQVVVVGKVDELGAGGETELFIDAPEVGCGG